MLRYIAVFIVTIFFFNGVSFSQATPNTGQYEYYMSISGVNSKDDVRKIEKMISDKEGVSFFMANRFPVRYFLLRSTKLIAQQEFSAWLVNTSYQLKYMGIGMEGKEEAIMTGRRNN
jgi:hypothetical protein